MKTDLAKYNNEWFKKEIGASFLKQSIWYYINVFFLKGSLVASSSVRVGFLRLFGAKIGNNVRIKPGVSVKYPWKLTVGKNTWIGEDVWIDNLTDVIIGSNCCLSQGAMLLTGNHDFTSETFDLSVKKIVLEDGVWICAKSVVTPGAVCRSHSVLTTGSVGVKLLEAYGIYSGNPATLKKTRQITK